MLEYIFSWTTFYYLLLVLYVPSCIGLITIVLLQKGKGVGFAGAFGAGPGSEAVFGPRNIRSLPQKLTYTLATIFMVLAIIISIIYGRVSGGVAPELVDEVAATGNYDALFDGTAAEGGDTDAGADAAAPTINVEVQGDGDAPVAVTPTVSVETVEEAADATEADAAPAADAVAEDAAEVVETVDATAADAAPAADAVAEEAVAVVEAVEATVEEAADEAVDAVEEAVTEENAQ